MSRTFWRTLSSLKYTSARTAPKARHKSPTSGKIVAFKSFLKEYKGDYMPGGSSRELTGKQAEVQQVHWKNGTRSDESEKSLSNFWDKERRSDEKRRTARHIAEKEGTPWGVQHYVAKKNITECVWTQPLTGFSKTSLRYTERLASYSSGALFGTGVWQRVVSIMSSRPD